MKKLTIEEKAKRFDEVIERAKSEYQTHKSFNGFYEMLTNIFPELKESEDERTMEEIVRFIQMEVEDEIVGNKWIAWLEKQCHTDSIIEKAKTGKQRIIITETDGNANIDWDTRSLEDTRKLLECGLQYINTELEKQCEQKPVDNVEPRFNIGLSKVLTTYVRYDGKH